MSAYAARSEEKKLKFKLSPTAEEHLDEILVIEQAVFSEPWRREDFQRLIETPDTLCFTALAEGRVAGYSCCWRVIETAELGNLAVAPEYQGRSLGSSLLEETLKACRARRVSAIFLEVRITNVRAIYLYERRGFIRIGLRRNYYTRPPEDAVIMKLEL